MATRYNLDEKDQAIFTERLAALAARTVIKVGDFIRLPDGTIKRVAHVWTDDFHAPELVQPTFGKDGSYYLGKGYASYSGGLNIGIPAEKFTATNETLPGYVWFFHHDYHTGDNAVYAKAEFPVWNCSVPSAF